MGQKIDQFRRRKAARKALADLFLAPKDVFIIHYSCESFYDRPDGSSPRVTSIAVRNLYSAQTRSFSIHQVAERKSVKIIEIASQFNILEKQMLKEFYEYIKLHYRCRWLHWNMRDINYGFPALEHRAQVLGVKCQSLVEDNLHDLSRIFIALYGKSYIDHPRIEQLIKLNNISDKDVLSGAMEADAFVNKEYVKLHQSTLRKVDIFANLAQLAEENRLKTLSSWWEKNGGSIPAAAEWIKEHWIVSSLVTICTLIASIYKAWPALNAFFSNT